ncbi:MAG: hypothetical protein ABIK09_17030 [Pseudomonadota bacterium]
MDLKNPSKWVVWGGVVLLTILLGLADWKTGHELNFFVFYFAPIGMAAWYLGYGASTVVAIVCAIVWFNADHLTNYIYVSPAYAVWNTMIRLCSFLIISWSTSRIRTLLTLEHQATDDLRRTLSEIKILQGLVPICAQCKKIRDDQGIWHPMEVYISDRTEARFSHGYCPECARRALEEAGLRDPARRPTTR